MTSAIRPIVLAFLQRPSDGALLVTEHVSARGDRRVRPIGGGIEFDDVTLPILDAPHETAFWWTDRHPARLVPTALPNLLAGTGND